LFLARRVTRANRGRLSSLLAGDADWSAHCVTDAEIQAAVDFMISTVNLKRNTP
jgi:hypothetical protein